MANEIISTDVDEIGDFWARAVLPYTAPIVEANQRREPDPIGSGVRVTLAAKEYLVTAAHVVDAHLEGSGKEQPKGAPYTFVPEQINIEGEVTIAPDPIDLAIIRLANASRPGLRLPQHLALEVSEGELCLFLGFQARAKSWEINSSPLTIRSRRPLSYMGRVIKPSADRFRIRFNEKRTQRGGVRQNAVGKLNGISGAGVFVLRQDSPRLAGIVIEYHTRASEIIATSSLALWRVSRSI